jgi:hypothetical protein
MTMTIGEKQKRREENSVQVKLSSQRDERPGKENRDLCVDGQKRAQSGKLSIMRYYSSLEK